LFAKAFNPVNHVNPVQAFRSFSILSILKNPVHPVHSVLLTTVIRVKQVKHYQLLVFDWDGTLMDSAARIVSCLRGAIAETGAEDREDAALRDIIGLGLDEAILALYPEADARFLEDFRDAYRVHFLERDETPSTLFPGVAQLLSDLESAGYWMAVATGKSRRGLDRVLSDTGLGQHFSRQPLCRRDLL
jgi:phosphoglycolate phosphatase-like HAD superfamily hydrolase